ncbi:MAG: hypothetical protein HY376_02105 [Candidatus Blackburnbacteria bacterium]|nr:hypothetical protein [Candidatus Blackburnbacteria bacterium]
MDVADIPPHTYRRFGNPYQEVVSSATELECKVSENNGLRPCHISAAYYNEKDCVTPILPFVVFDFDSCSRHTAMFSVDYYIELNKSLNDLILSYTFLMEHGFDRLYADFTGGRGFHLFVPVLPKSYTREQLLDFQWGTKYAVEKQYKVELSTFCHDYVGRPKGLIRIPNSIHEGTGLFCRPIDGELDCSIQEIVHRAENPRFVHRNGYHKIDAAQFSQDMGYRAKKQSHSQMTTLIPVTVQERPNFTPTVIKELFIERPCLYAAISQGEPDHLARVYAVSYLNKKCGLSKEEVLYVLSQMNWNDFDATVSSYQINQIYETDYEPPRCSTMQEKSMCMGDVCSVWKKSVKDKCGRILFT